MLKLAAVALLAFAGAADAHRAPRPLPVQRHTIIHDADPVFQVQEQGYIDSSLVPTPGQTIPVIHSATVCGSAPACATMDSRVRVIYVNPGQPGSTPEDDRYYFMHEVGHAFDRLVLNRRERHRFIILDTLPADTSWADENGGDSPGTPMEDFANVYASCATQGPAPPVSDYRGLFNTVTGAVDYPDEAKACGLIELAAKRWADDLSAGAA